MKSAAARHEFLQAIFEAGHSNQPPCSYRSRSRFGLYTLNVIPPTSQPVNASHADAPICFFAFSVAIRHLSSSEDSMQKTQKTQKQILRAFAGR